MTIVGGGGFRVPLVIQALAESDDGPTDVVLYDVDERRLEVIAAVCAQIPGAPRVRASTNLADALAGSAFVFSAIRVGAAAGRVIDERVAIAHGLLGQETIGAGGLAYALRTVPIADDLAAAIALHAPDAWTLNFTNPAGIITEAMRAHLGERVFGICDSPLGLVRRAARVLNLDAEQVQPDYAGLNHLGWLTALRSNGTDVLPALLGDDGKLDALAEGELFGHPALRRLGMIPNEYLYYYQGGAREAPDTTRGEYLAEQQDAFYAPGPTGDARQRWVAALDQRESTYMSDAREGERTDTEDGGYHEVAVRVMAALSGQRTGTETILGVANGGALASLPDDAVIEVPCAIDQAGAHPRPLQAALGSDQLDLMRQVQHSGSVVIAAARQRSTALAVQGFAEHPLIGAEKAAGLVADYRASHPSLAQLLPSDD